jgi:8-oxo-dGTP diphosphatase
MANAQRLQTVSAFLFNPDGAVIAQLRDDKPGLMFPAHWSTLGGRIEEGESPDEAMRRELIEEIEICPPMTFWRLFEHNFVSSGISFDVDIYAYVGEIDMAIEDIRLHEGQRLAYLSLSDIDNLLFAFGLDHLYREFFAAHDHRTRSHL